MRNSQQSTETTDRAARTAQERPRTLTRAYRRSGGLAVLAAASAVALAALSATSSARDAGPGKDARGANRRASDHTHRTRARSATALFNDRATQLLAEWTTCERSHGDPGQAAPTVDAHGVISITIPIGATPAGEPHNLTGTCSEYLAGAQHTLSGGQPVAWGDHAKYVQFANCMRVNGYPTYPYPSGIENDGHESTNFNGTGIDPESPALLNGSANQTCGRQIGAPAWWINGWGPAGDIEVADAGVPRGVPPTTAGPNSPKPVLAPGGTG